MATKSRKRKQRRSQDDLYADITARILDSLENGTVPWRRPWSDAGRMRSIYGRPYRGINAVLTSMAAMVNGYDDPRWLTYNKAAQHAGPDTPRGKGRDGKERPFPIRKGERGTEIVFWSTFQKTETDPETGEEIDRVIPWMRFFTVFNVEQTVGLELPALPEPDETLAPIDEAQRVAMDYIDDGGPELQHGGDRAAYSPVMDRVFMPQLQSFDSAAAYHGTLFHELVHSTGHETRLDRKLGNGFGSEPYAREELVAEMGAAFLLGACGIFDGQADQSAAYVDGWRQAITDDPKAIVYAAGRAQKAADLVLGIDPAEAADDQ